MHSSPLSDAMIVLPPMTRRGLLKRSMIAAAVVATGGFALWRYSSPRKLGLAFPLVLSGFCDEATLRDVGRRYLTQVPAEGSVKVLLSRLAAEGGRRGSDAADENEEISDAASQAEQDFRTMKILMIDGWVISETEARQCALLALS